MYSVLLGVFVYCNEQLVPEVLHLKIIYRFWPQFDPMLVYVTCSIVNGKGICSEGERKVLTFYK